MQQPSSPPGWSGRFFLSMISGGASACHRRPSSSSPRPTLSDLHWVSSGAKRSGRSQGASLKNADLQGASLDVAKLQGASLDGAKLQGASLRDAVLHGASLNGARLQGAEMFDAQLQGASLSGTQLQGADLGFAQLQGAWLFGVQLQAAALEAAQLEGATLDAANLEGANLGYANLQGASLQQARLLATNLSMAFVWRTNRADFERIPGAPNSTAPSNVISPGLPDRWLPIWRDGRGNVHPWDDAVYQALRSAIESLPTGVPRDQALEIIRRIDCANHDQSLASCDLLLPRRLKPLLGERRSSTPRWTTPLTLRRLQRH